MKRFVALVLWVFFLLMVFSNWNQVQQRYYKNGSAGPCSEALNNPGEMPKEFNGPALYGRVFKLLGACHIELADPSARTKWSQQWEHKFTADQLSDRKKTGEAISQMVKSLHGRWDFFDVGKDEAAPTATPAIPTKASKAVPAKAPEKPVVPQVVHVNDISRDIVEITIDGMTPEVPQQMRDALKQVQGKPVVILNLANNPGGYVNETVEVGSYLRSEGSFMTEFERIGDGFVTEPVLFDPEFIVHQEADGKIVRTKHEVLLNPSTHLYVLISGNTASAAEILAGGLRKRATLIGSRTLGKRVGQLWLTLQYGASMHLTSFKFALGGDKDEQPLDPDVKASNALGCAVILERKMGNCK